MEQSLYEKLHQRYPIPRLLKYIADNDVRDIHTENFVSIYDEIRSRNPYYAKTLAKLLIDNIHLLDEECSDPSKIRIHPWVRDDGVIYFSEWLYEQYIDLLNVGMPTPTSKDVIRYSFKHKERSISVDIEETPYLICASGTTGFRTWEAALYLSQHLCKNSDEIMDELGKDQITVAELGAGTGIVSMTWAKLQHNRLEKLYVTDGDSSLVENQMHRNAQLNNVGGPKYCFQKLWWNSDDVPDNDLILAADVTYDSSVIPDLVLCIKSSLQAKTKFALITATVRNVDTIKVFEEKCRSEGLQWTVVRNTETEDSSKFTEECTFKDLIAPIRIYRVSL